MGFMTFVLIHKCDSKTKILELSRLTIKPYLQTDIIDYCLSWMKDKSNIFISNINPNYTKEDLYNFIRTKTPIRTLYFWDF